MTRYVPYEKLSKKRKREEDAKRRGSWGEINPVTRKPDNPKAYQRQKARSWKQSGGEPFVFRDQTDGKRAAFTQKMQTESSRAFDHRLVPCGRAASRFFFAAVSASMG